jgi:hypothetical protein
VILAVLDTSAKEVKEQKFVIKAMPVYILKIIRPSEVQTLKISFI